MKRVAMAGGIAALALLAACATTPAPVPLRADAEGKALLYGEWAGEYFSPATGRVGSIAFTLHENCDCGLEYEHAHGDVLMIPRDAGPLRPFDDGDPTYSTPEPQVLGIQSLEVTGDQLIGIVEPYRDPDTGHPVSTTFEGTIRGDVIAGEFVSVDGRTGDRAVGTWKVTRKPKKH